MRLAHIGDIHFCRERAKDVFASLDALQKYIGENPVDLIAIAGDTFDSAVINSGSAEFPDFIEAVKKLGDTAPVAMVYGTPSHDVDGCLEIFKSVNSSHGITILEPGQPYFLTDFARGLIDEADAINSATAFRGSYNPQAIIFGIPEPRKKYLLANGAAGKDETEEAVRDAMRKMCFLLAAKRREYANIPCVVLYHGEVAGTTYQNDRTIERGTGISITIDELGDIGADYYALGHIHKPQQVGNLPAYYAGSVYPKNFGETHKAGFNVVTFNGEVEGHKRFDTMNVDRVDFLHPQNLKIEVDAESQKSFDKILTQDALKKEGVAGKRVWLEITCSKERRAFIDTESELTRLRQAGAAEDSRVTINDIPTETVRAAEITEAATPEKKFEIWARNSETEAREGITRKITALANDITLCAAKPSGEWELVSLRLRGATGIKKGTGKDEIAINFDGYENGVIALTGANGRGKTTLIENCHPYPQLLTRRGTLREHFFLRDGFREVIYRNRADGSMRKFLIQIDGQNKSGTCKYFVFTIPIGTGGAFAEPVFFNGQKDLWLPLHGVDGNLKPYTEAVMNIFGPIELYQRTAFITQRPTKDLPDLTDATAGEKKSLFAALAGIDYLQGFADAAAEKSKKEAAAVHDAEIRLQMLESAAGRKDAETQALARSESLLKNYRCELDGVTAQGKTAKADMEKKREAWNAEQERARKEEDARLAVDTATAEITRLNNDVQNYQTAAENKAAYEAGIAGYETLQKTVEDESAKKQEITEANLKKAQGFAKVKAEFDAQVKAVETERGNLCDRRNGIERLILDAQSNIRLYERDAAEIKEDCPTCGQKLPEAKIAELTARRNEFVAKIEKEKENIANRAAQIEDANKRVEELARQAAELSFDEPEPPAQETFDDTVLLTAAEKLRRINIDETRKLLSRAQEASARIEGLRAQIADREKLLAEHEARYKKLLPAPGQDGRKIRNDLDAAEKRHAELAEQYAALKAEIARTEANIETSKRALAEIETRAAEMKKISENIAQSKTEAAEWDVIARAFGKDGIQALELDALAPGISETANRILRAAYGDRFRIEIRTTRMGGAGKKTRQIEDFLIYVTDSADADGQPVPLDNKSGGEAVWIKRAIYDAFAVIRKRNTAFAFLTCFQDETDGALDSESKTAYCRMLEAAHAESKLRHTIIITHSNEVKAMIEQKIDMAELAA